MIIKVLTTKKTNNRKQCYACLMLAMADTNGSGNKSKLKACHLQYCKAEEKNLKKSFDNHSKDKRRKKSGDDHNRKQSHACLMPAMAAMADTQMVVETNQCHSRTGQTNNPWQAPL